MASLHSTSEPSPAWQEQRHLAIVQQDPVAFAELCEQALPHLVSFLRLRFPHVDEDLIDTAAIDCLLSYNAKPRQFQAGKLSLFAFLRMASRYDVLNALQRWQRDGQYHLALESLDQHAYAPGADGASAQLALDELVAGHTNLSFREMLTRLEVQLDEVEKKVLWLMLQGEQELAVFAAALGLVRWDEREQRSEVNRVKDRLAKKLQRFGEKLKYL